VARRLGRFAEAVGPGRAWAASGRSLPRLAAHRYRDRRDEGRP